MLLIVFLDAPVTNPQDITATLKLTLMYSPITQKEVDIFRK
jgi:hypothetical protein